ncbi:MAG: TonB-dependent receptor [Acidobacteria bacterium]|nr:TonB-dependent receptor [Acidobacteriota bacterium]
MTLTVFLAIVGLGLQATALPGTVVDVSGAAVPDAKLVAVMADGREAEVAVARDGSFVLEAPRPARLRIRATGFSSADISLADAPIPLRVVLQPSSFAESVVVTADRGAERLPNAASATVLTAAELANAAPAALDDVLRQTPGFSLFRRSSSRVANPTTQGVTLRGVSGSGASRTLVLADGVPLNDPFGSWVYWNRVPVAAVERVEVVRGAAGDLYGADALGGVVQVLTFAPGRARLRATVDGGSHDTARVSMFAGASRGPWFGSASGEWLDTAGVVTIAPEERGIVDVEADSDYRTGYMALGTQRSNWHASARVNVYSEGRGNGTPLQVNSTAWRQLGGEAGGLTGGGAWQVHVSGGTQEYFQTFTAVATARASERLTTEQWTPSDFVSASGQWSRTLGRHGLLVGAETHRTESTVDEYRYSLTNVRSGPFVVGGTERGGAGFARVSLAASNRVTIGLGARVDMWRSEPIEVPIDQVQPSDQSASFFSPRASVAWRLGDIALQSAVYRGHRTPTLNELHRGFRAGNVVTNPNPLLEPETLTGVEGGALYSAGRVSARATAFWNTLDGAIANITLSATPTLITRERRNSDEIRSTGVEIEADVRLLPTLTTTGQVTFTRAQFQGSIAAPQIEGNRVPQVPGVQYAAGLTWSDPTLLTLAGLVRGTSTQFDDDLNVLELGSFAVVDVTVSRGVTRAVQAFFAVENLLDREYDVGRTPTRTIGWPRTFRVGARIALP